jgi:uncharacterized glyoxalase superfamily protein PhnB
MNDDSEPRDGEKWYARAVFSVVDIGKSLGYYCDLLGFEQTWKHEENGRITVTQVNKGEFEIILSEELDRVGQARVFIALEAAELENLQQAILKNRIPSEPIHWGYQLIRLRDPDGNELLVSMENCV